MQKLNKTNERWKEELSQEQYDVLRCSATEAPFSGAYWNTKDKGMYLCAGCGQELFSSETKFDSGTGWPSFWQPVTKESVESRQDSSLGMTRTEIRCSRCGGHLGHVFNDLPRLARLDPPRIDFRVETGSAKRALGKAGGPNPTGQRYCINSAALRLKKAE